MAEKEHQSVYPTAPAPAANGGYGRSDTEAAAASHDAKELRKKKRIKCFLYIFLFAVFQIGVITVFSLTIMKTRTPKFRIRSAEVASFTTGTAENPSFTGRINAEFSVKNANFGRYKYRNTTVEFFYRGSPVGRALVPNSRAGWRSTKKFNAAVDLSSPVDNSSELANDLRAGVLQLTSQATMRGRVELIFVMKKNRSTRMNCTMEIVLATPQQIRNVVCK